MQVTAGVDEPPSCSPEGWSRCTIKIRAVATGALPGYMVVQVLRGTVPSACRSTTCAPSATTSATASVRSSPTSTTGADQVSPKGAMGLGRGPGRFLLGGEVLLGQLGDGGDHPAVDALFAAIDPETRSTRGSACWRARSTDRLDDEATQYPTNPPPLTRKMSSPQKAISPSGAWPRLLHQAATAAAGEHAH